MKGTAFMKIVLLGGPGAGKGTQSKIISEKFQISHISTGEILRRAMEDKTEIGIQVEHIMNEGNLVPDQLAIDILKDRIAEKDCERGFVLDGFPRTLKQAELLENVVGEVDKIIYISVPDEYVIRRMSGRYTCPKCGAMYHLEYNRPERDGYCNSCNLELVQREDDRIRTVENRLKVFHELTKPIVDYFKNRDMLVEINGIGEINSITNLIAAAVDRHQQEV